MHLIEMDRRSIPLKRKRHMSENSAVAMLESVLTPPKTKRAKADEKTPIKDAKENICIDKQLHMDPDYSPKFTAKSFYGSRHPLQASPREAPSFPVSPTNHCNKVVDAPVVTPHRKLNSRMSPSTSHSLSMETYKKTPKMISQKKLNVKSHSASKSKSKRKFGKLAWVQRSKSNGILPCAKTNIIRKADGNLSSKAALSSNTTPKSEATRSPQKQGYVFNFSSPQWPKPAASVTDEKSTSAVQAFNDFDGEHDRWSVEPKDAVKKFFKNTESGTASPGTPSNVVLKIGFQGKIVAHRETVSSNDKSSARASASKSKMFPFVCKKPAQGGVSKVNDIASDPMLRKLREELLGDQCENTPSPSSPQLSNVDHSSAIVSIEHSHAKVRSPLTNLNSNSCSTDCEQYNFGVINESKLVGKTASLHHLDTANNDDSSNNSAMLSKKRVYKNNNLIESEYSVSSLSSVCASRKDVVVGDKSGCPIDVDSVCSELGGSEELFSQSASVVNGGVSPDISDTESTESGPTTRRRMKSMQSRGTPTRTSPQSTPKQSTLAKYFKTSASPIIHVTKISPSPHRRLSSPRLMKEHRKDAREQYILDAGQKQIGAIQCEECGMVYSIGDVTDETMHAKHHHDLLTTLKFPGWKKERVVQEYDDDGARVVLVFYDDPKYVLKKVDDLSRVMARDLGFPPEDAVLSNSSKVFLYISDDKCIEGCCVSETISKGYRVIPDSSEAFNELRSPLRRHRPWCCQTDPEPATVGISRIWVCAQSRRKGIATRLLDCLRHWFSYGAVIEKSQISFSDPTPDGRQLAMAYTGTSAFLVYKYNTNMKQFAGPVSQDLPSLAQNCLQKS